MIEQFLSYLRSERNRSPLTVKHYGEDLAAFEAFFTALDDGLDWASVDGDVIRMWMEAMMDKGNTASSVCRRLSAVRSFFRYALSHGMVERDPAHGIRGPKKSRPLPQYVREREMKELLSPDRWDLTSFKDTRARAILIILYETGIRSAELLGLRDGDVDMRLCELKVTGKRDKQRIVPFGEGLRATLRHYIEVRDATVGGAGDALFTTERGTALSYGTLRRIVKDSLTGACTLKKRSPHVLRHTFATAMLNHDAGIESVRKLLGHESLATTEIYTHTTFEQLKKVYSEAHPRA